MSAESGAARKKRMTTASSIFSRISRASGSMRSRTSSMLTKFQRDMLGLQEHDAVRAREWLLAFVEFLLSFSWNCFTAREKSEKTFEMRNVTPRQDTLASLFWTGCASLANLSCGYFMDSFTGSYIMSLFNVIMHFSLASLFLIGEIVYETSSEDVYAPLLSHVFLWSFVPIKALGFTRYVYCMDQVGGKGGAFIMHFTFIFGFFQMMGSFVFSMVIHSNPSAALLSAIAFSFNGSSLFIYSYLLRPKRRLAPAAPPETATKVWALAYTALQNKRKLRNKIRRQDWLEFAENKYDKLMIMRTRRLFRVIYVILPSAGFLLFTVFPEVIFKSFYDSLKLSGPDVPGYTRWVISLSTVFLLLFVEYFVLPSLRTCKIKINFMRRFIIGYIALLVGVTMATILSSVTEKIVLRPSNGIFRVYNTMEGTNLSFTPEDSFTRLGFGVRSKGATSVTFQAQEKTQFQMRVTFLTHNNTIDASYTQYFNLDPGRITQYVAIDPNSIQRVPTFPPVFEAPPGRNDAAKPRCFMVSLIGDRKQFVQLINNESESQHLFEIEPGHIEIFQVPEGNYTLRYRGSIFMEVPALLQAGGLYGIYLYLGFNEYEIDVDKVVPENTNHGLFVLGLLLPLTLARGIGKIALDAFVYTSAPEGLKGTAYGFYFFIIHFNAFILLIGFSTWHHFITPNVIVAYAICGFVAFFFCLTLLIRYRHHHSM